ncbi:MAG: EF-P lysine aminoacylase GenX [SAR324 cluster bacterium]|nr:EF-P lysine aminoacylase GenX [SAR324 cluster bacterium]MBL7035438.1 EF-P lysine aminoacylase GenX [SAR324 cluster bacterium]
MSRFLQTSSKSLLAGNYHGRVIEVSLDSERSKESCSEPYYKVLTVIEDEVFQLIIEEKNKITVGALIFFEVAEDGALINIKTRKASTDIETEGDLLRWRRPVNNPSRMELLRRRQQILRYIREWFDEQKFIETETPILVPAPSPEAQLFPVKTDSGYLISSPEFQMKRLLAGGFEKIFQFARCFRKAESSPRHNPEFTMLEWYRTNEPLEKLMSDIEQMVLRLTETISTKCSLIQIPPAPWQRKSVSELFKKHLDIYLDGTETALQLRKKAQLAGFEDLLVDTSETKTTESLAYERLFFQLWNHIETKFEPETPVFVYDWPLPLASLARQSPKKPGFAERVELYAGGMELANGFGELTDALEQRRRFEQDLKNRVSEGLDTVPLDERFLNSLELGLPVCSGMALGVDRLIMWLCGVQKIREVICFSAEEV